MIRRSWLTDIFFLSLVLLCFYFAFLGTYPFFTPDEGRYSEVAREMVASGDYITPRVNGVAFLDKPILYYWLQASAIYLFGVKEWSLRFFPAVLGVLGCLITYICTRSLFNRRTALLAAALLGTTPLYFAGSHYADLNLEVAVFISSSLLFFLTGLEKNFNKSFLFAAYLCVACAFLTKGLIALAFPIMITGLWILILNRWFILKRIYILSGLVLFFALSLPWYVLVQKANPQFFHYFFVTQQITRFLSHAEFNNPTPIWFYLPIVLIGFFPWTIFLIQALYTRLIRIWKNKQAEAATLFLWLWAAVILIFFSIPSSKTIGYIFPIFPPLAILTAQYLDQRLSSSYSLKWTALNFIVISLVLANLVFYLPSLNLVDLPASFQPYRIILSLTFLAAALLGIWAWKKNSLRYLLASMLAWSLVFLLTLTASASYLNDNSSKELSLQLKSIIQEQDKVVTYFKYYQDLPLYLQRKVLVVADWQAPDIESKDNWVREFWYGMPFQDTKDRLINEKRFLSLWHGPQRVFVLLNKNYLEQFKASVKEYYILGEEHEIVLISNQK